MNKKVATKATMLDEAAQTAVLEVAKKVTAKPDETLKLLTDIQLDLGARIASIQSTMAENIKTVADLDQAIELKKEQLKQWGEVTDLTLMLDTLKAEIAATKESWTAEAEARAIQWAQEETERETAQTREETLYVINRDAKRKEEEATYTAARTATRLKHTDEDLVRDRTYTARLAELTEREKTLEGLQAQVAGIQTLVDGAVKKAEGTLRGVLTSEFNHQRALAEKDVATAKALSEAEIKALKETVARVEKTNVALTAQAEASNTKVADMAAQYAAALSGQKALGAVQEFASTQNTNAAGKR